MERDSECVMEGGRERENLKKRKMKRAREIENSTERQTGRDRE